ncbi:MAG: oxidoreductase [Gammaproteobacteria bacterium RIFCSPHIGHO2_12_FULL_63_22]|nr:MAG: oxidoreductase [Gammaproteobacteria bacterium RIFCSPHIGHO2_12_FULL_63_22]
MGLLTKILEKLGLGTAHAATPDIRATGKKPGITGTATAPPPPRVVTPATPAAVPVVDVVAQLEKRAADNPQKLNWKTSIVDLLKLLDIDSGLADRKELAKELGCPPALMEDSAKMNMWLHKEVLARIAANGGNVPANLLD